MDDASLDRSDGTPAPYGLAFDIRNQHSASILEVRDAAAIAGLRAQVAAQAAVIREQALALVHSRKIFERASAAARIGVWECCLADQALTWTDVVYELFDLPVGSPVDRTTTLACYTPESKTRLEAIRSRAIADRNGFALDAEIVTGKGNRRWIRLTATVECEDGVPVRIFGMKQDITAEKLLADRTRYLAEFDQLTGLPNRGVFQSRLAELEPADSLLLIDLDGFKAVNDTHGHAAGDACLAVVGSRLRAACHDAELVARIGGDEFGIVVGEGVDPESVATRIVESVRAPIVWNGLPLTIGASVGISRASGCASEDVFNRADSALYAAKAAGRNTFRIASQVDPRAGPSAAGLGHGDG